MCAFCFFFLMKSFSRLVKVLNPRKTDKVENREQIANIKGRYS